jgi:pimeloyl-ACP methyl ester carboxylesterase
MEVREFHPYIADDVLQDLNERLGKTRLPPDIGRGEWSHGTRYRYLAGLIDYWRDEFDWREQERRLERWKHYMVTIRGHRIHLVRAVIGRGAKPLILTHGWPSTFYELTHLIEPFRDMANGGGYELVIPSLPGYAFSRAAPQPWETPTIHELWKMLMVDALGHTRFGAHGGDLGAGITAKLGMLYPEHVTGIHVTGVYAPGAEAADDLTEAERAYIQRESRWEQVEGGYAHMQATRPLTLAYSLTDSPAGLAAWIVEKFRAWSDCNGEVESRFTKDQLLTTITLYWVTRSIATSFLPYFEASNNPDPIPWRPIEVPCAVALFPADISAPPREWAERYYSVARWTEMPSGGHFPAMEEPHLLSQDMHAFFGSLQW